MRFSRVILLRKLFPENRGMKQNVIRQGGTAPLLQSFFPSKYTGREVSDTRAVVPSDAPIIC